MREIHILSGAHWPKPPEPRTRIERAREAQSKGERRGVITETSRTIARKERARGYTDGKRENDETRRGGTERSERRKYVGNEGARGCRTVGGVRRGIAAKEGKKEEGRGEVLRREGGRLRSEPETDELMLETAGGACFRASNDLVGATTCRWY